MPYGTMSAVELCLTDIMSKLVVDDWGQCRTGKFGALRAHVEAGTLSEASLHAELGQIVAGLRPGRENDDETILLWHRGLSLSDIALGHAIVQRAIAGRTDCGCATPEAVAAAGVTGARPDYACRMAAGSADCQAASLRSAASSRFRRPSAPRLRPRRAPDPIRRSRYTRSLRMRDRQAFE